MLTNSQLDELLAHWTREYGWGGMPGPGSWNIIQTLVDHEGFVPTGRGYVGVQLQTIADEVEAAVSMLEATLMPSGQTNMYFRAAKVLRTEHLSPRHWPESERLHFLKRRGLQMSRHTYYRALQFGRAFLMGYMVKSRAA